MIAKYLQDDFLDIVLCFIVSHTCTNMTFIEQPYEKLFCISVSKILIGKPSDRSDSLTGLMQFEMFSKSRLPNEISKRYFGETDFTKPHLL